MINCIISSLSAFEYTSQVEQDKWAIEEIFSFKENGYFIEIGAADGIHFSNTYVLEKELGWQGICIEPFPLSFNNGPLNLEVHKKRHRNY